MKHSDYIQNIIDSLVRQAKEMEAVKFTSNTIEESNLHRKLMTEYLRVVAEKLGPVAQTFRDADL